MDLSNLGPIEYGDRSPANRDGDWYIVKTRPRYEKMVIRMLQVLKDNNPEINDILEIQLPYMQVELTTASFHKWVDRRKQAPYFYIRVQRTAFDYGVRYLLEQIDGVTAVYRDPITKDEAERALSFDKYTGWKILPGEKLMWINKDNIGADWFGTALEYTDAPWKPEKHLRVDWLSSRGAERVSVYPVSELVKVGYRFDV